MHVLDTVFPLQENVWTTIFMLFHFTVLFLTGLTNAISVAANMLHKKQIMQIIVAFYDGVTDPVDMGRASDVIYLVLCKTFDTVLHGIFVYMERHGPFSG